MKILSRLLLLTSISLMAYGPAKGAELSSQEIMSQSEKVADYFIKKYPDVGAKSNVGGKVRNSKIWTRGVFYEGLLNLCREDAREEWLKYCLDWGEFHKWISSSDTEAKRHNADYQCCGQAYLQMYKMDPQPVRMEHIKMRIDAMIASERINYWTWVDAIQMSMPVIALLGDITGDTSYWEYMYDAYMYTRDEQGGSKKGGGQPLFNTSTGLWYRDAGFDPPYTDKTETDKDCYWSRGNGWAYMALARVLQFTPADEAHRGQYEEDFKLMSRGLLDCQRADGSWSVSLAAPTNFGSEGSEGPEMTGTALFVGGMAWGVREGLLDAETYMPAIEKGWESMAKAVHQDTGFVGYLQGTGSKPEDGGPITYDSVPDFEDFGIGCWLWGAAETHSLAAKLEDVSGIEAVSADNPAAAAPLYYDLQGRPAASPVPGQLYIRDGKILKF